MKIFVAGLLSLSFLVVACDGDDSDAINNALNEPDLNGRYTSACSESELADLSMSVTYRFNTDGTFSRYQDFYTKADCMDDAVEGTVEIAGNFKVDNDGAPNSEGGAITFELKSAFITVDSETLANAMNSVNFCGRSDYAVGQKVEVTTQTGDTLCPVRDVPQTLYGVYRESDNQLVFNKGGLNEMSQAEASRPLELDTTRVFYKQ